MEATVPRSSIRQYWVGLRQAALDEETFEPLAAIVIAEDIEDAIRVANHSEFGLSGAIWTADINCAKSLAPGLETGDVFINGMLRLTHESRSVALKEWLWKGTFALRYSGVYQCSGCVDESSVTMALPVKRRFVGHGKESRS